MLSGGRVVVGQVSDAVAGFHHRRERIERDGHAALHHDLRILECLGHADRSGLFQRLDSFLSREAKCVEAQRPVPMS